eukprot:SAG11_NODE_4132_length_2047_cov_1.078542_1_plen_40_part_10
MDRTYQGLIKRGELISRSVIRVHMGKLRLTLKSFLARCAS